MQFFKSESGEFLAVETCPHMGLVVRRRESYDVAPGLWGAPEVTLDDGVLREEDEFGVTTFVVVETTAEDVITAWGFDPRTAIWSQRHRQWIFPAETWEERQVRSKDRAKRREFEARFEREYSYAD